MQCPTCRGAKKVFAFLNKGEAPATHTQEMVPCMTCQGTGEVDAEHAQRVVEGQAYRKTRVARNENLYLCAKRLGVPTSELSKFESGLAVSDEARIKILGKH